MLITPNVFICFFLDFKEHPSILVLESNEQDLLNGDSDISKLHIDMKPEMETVPINNDDEIAPTPTLDEVATNSLET